MPELPELQPVIHNTSGPAPAPVCGNHTHRRPIHPSTLTAHLWVREEIARRHADHHLPEPGCPTCFSAPESLTRQDPA